MVVIIPAYQPDERLLQLIDTIRRDTPYPLVVVNDGSGPGCEDIFDRLPPAVTLLAHEINRGKGRAIKTALAHIGDHYPNEDGVVVVDADGQHLPADMLRVCAALREHPDALVLGSRRLVGKVPLRSRFGNAVTRYLFAVASGVRVHDTQTGLRAFSLARIPEMLNLKGERYEYEMNMLLYAAEEDIPIVEVPIETIYIQHNASSHFHVLRDSVRIYSSILKFVGSSLLASGIDFVMLFCLHGVFRHLLPEAKTALLAAVVGARAVSSAVNFFINKKLVFKSRQDFWPSALKYYAVVLLIMAANFELLNLLNVIAGIPLFWAKILTEVLLFTISFVLQRAFVFRKKKPAKK